MKKKIVRALLSATISLFMAAYAHAQVFDKSTSWIDAGFQSAGKSYSLKPFDRNGRIYNSFKVDVTAGYAHWMDGGTAAISFGLNLSVEPKYNITDNIAAGFKLEGALFFASDDDDASLLTMTSYSLTGEYLFGTGKVRPYLGVAAGLYKPTFYLTDLEDEIYKFSLDNTLGFAPRAGFQFGKFRLGTEFNIVKDNSLDIDYSYLTIKMGATIGGGRRR